jgi:hypothetical protein
MTIARDVNQFVIKVFPDLRKSINSAIDSNEVKMKHRCIIDCITQVTNEISKSRAALLGELDEFKLRIGKATLIESTLNLVGFKSPKIRLLNDVAHARLKLLNDAKDSLSEHKALESVANRRKEFIT